MKAFQELYVLIWKVLSIEGRNYHADCKRGNQDLRKICFASWQETCHKAATHMARFPLRGVERVGLLAVLLAAGFTLVTPVRLLPMLRFTPDTPSYHFTGGKLVMQVICTAHILRWSLLSRFLPR